MSLKEISNQVIFYFVLWSIFIFCDTHETQKNIIWVWYSISISTMVVILVGYSLVSYAWSSSSSFQSVYHYAPIRMRVSFIIFRLLPGHDELLRDTIETISWLTERWFMVVFQCWNRSFHRPIATHCSNRGARQEVFNDIVIHLRVLMAKYNSSESKLTNDPWFVLRKIIQSCRAHSYQSQNCCGYRCRPSIIWYIGI